MVQITQTLSDEDVLLIAAELEREVTVKHAAEDDEEPEVPSISSNYWTSFFPAVVLFGFGMAITVAPLTTTVMGSVSEEQAGVASGINNAVSRTAGLLAIAVFGVVILHAFSRELGTRLNAVGVDEQVRSSIYEQRVKLAGVEVPGHLDSQHREQIKRRSPVRMCSVFVSS